MHRLRALLSSLRVFDAIYRTGTVSRAAEVLHVTPGAVSQQLKQLEGAMGALFVRQEGRELELSEPGRRFALRLADAFDRIDNAIIEFTDGSVPRPLRVKVMPTLAVCWLVPRLPTFFASYADIGIEISATFQTGDLTLGPSDFIVRHGAGDWTDVEFDLLFEEAFVPVCSPSVAENIRGPADLLQMNLLHSLMRKDAWAIWFDSLGIESGTKARGISMANAALCYQAAANGLGVAMAQMAYVAADLKTGKLVAPIDHVAKTDLAYYLVCDPLKADNYAVKVFREWIRLVR